ncbi:uncharacterized protein [Oscarella lobularis]|uniref:uncharacterized protein n=1 Tax=Oscarella lobularis TaxID=121494 RepID=UPI0033130EAE
MIGVTSIIFAIVQFLGATVFQIVATGNFSGYVLPQCSPFLCFKPCANLGTELQYINVTFSKLPRFEGYRLALTIQPTTSLTDVALSAGIFGVILPGIRIHCGVKDYLCHDKANSWENKRCPIPAFQPTSYETALDEDDLMGDFENLLGANATFKLINAKGVTLACVNAVVTRAKPVIPKEDEHILIGGRGSSERRNRKKRWFNHAICNRVVHDMIT